MYIINKNDLVEKSQPKPEQPAGPNSQLPGVLGVVLPHPDEICAALWDVWALELDTLTGHLESLPEVEAPGNRPVEAPPGDPDPGPDAHSTRETAHAKTKAILSKLEGTLKPKSMTKTEWEEARRHAKEALDIHLSEQRATREGEPEETARVPVTMENRRPVLARSSTSELHSETSGLDILCLAARKATQTTPAEDNDGSTSLYDDTYEQWQRQRKRAKTTTSAKAISTTQTRHKEVNVVFSSSPCLQGISMTGLYRNPEIKDELAEWRESFTTLDAIKKVYDQDSYVVAEFACGAGCSALASIRCNMRHAFTTESNPHKAKLVEKLTQAPCLGEHYAINFKEVRKKYGHCHMIRTGFPCTDYARSSTTQSGEHGDTGWLFTHQCKSLLEMQPDLIMIEMVENALNINNGRAIKTVCAELKRDYVIDYEVLDCWRFGDVTSRRRVFIVGISKRFGVRAHSWKFPVGQYHEGRAPQAWMIAANDRDVPSNCWMTDIPKPVKWEEPVGGCLHLVARFGYTMGHSSAPNAVFSWFSLFSTQTTYGGGGRYLPRDWRPGEKISVTRKPIIEETVRIASLPSDFLTYLRASGGDDDFARDCINNGWPLRTAMAMTEQAKLTLDYLYSNKERKMEKIRHTALGVDSSRKMVKSLLLDTGAQISVMDPAASKLMDNPTTSSIVITSANTKQSKCIAQGTCRINALNTPGYEGFADATELSFEAVTMTPLTKELLSTSDLIANQGYGLHLVQGGVCELYKPATEHEGPARIPVRHDRHEGQFWIDYIPPKYARWATPEHHSILACNAHFMAMDASLVPMTFTDREAREMLRDLKADQSHAIEEIQEFKHNDQEVIYAQHPEDRAIRGVKASLNSDRQKMKARELHELFGHCGTAPDCSICKLVKGCMRRIIKTVDRHQETRPAHSFAMDMMVLSDRSIQGSKYLIVLTCMATKCRRLLPLYLKSDAVEILTDWVEEMRASPFFTGLAYCVVSKIHTDQDGAWSPVNRAFQANMRRLGVEITYATTDRHEKTAPLAERSVGICEVVMKSLLHQTNIGPVWWEYASSNCEFLLNRLPLAAYNSNTPSDGDCASPLELMTRGAYSRRMISKDLSTFIPVGTLALCHMASIKGSNIKTPKARWGVACGTLGSQIHFCCPCTFSRFYSKSFYAVKINYAKGMNYAHFLGLPPIEKVTKIARLPSDYSEEVDITLPTPAEPSLSIVPPASQVWYDLESRRRLGTAHADDGHPYTQIGHGAGWTPPEIDAGVRSSGGEGSAIPKPEGDAGQTAHNIANPRKGKAESPMAHMQPPGVTDHMSLEGVIHQFQDTEYEDANGGRRNIDPVVPNETLGHEPDITTIRGEVVHEVEAEFTGAYVDIKPLKLAMLRGVYRGTQRWTKGSSHNPNWYVVRDNQLSFGELCEQFKLSHSQTDAYAKQLIKQYNYDELLFRSKAKSKAGRCKKLANTHYLPKGMCLPLPAMYEGIQGGRTRSVDATVCHRNSGGSCGDASGSRCTTQNAMATESTLALEEQAGLRFSARPDIAEECLVDVAREWFKGGLIGEPLHIRGVTYVNLVQSANTKIRKAKSYKKKKIPQGAVGSLHEPPPTTVEKALNHPTRSWDWLRSLLDEWLGLEELGVLCHNHSLQQCKDMGITSSPVPMSLVMTYKHDQAGQIIKLKSRLVMRGTQRHCKPGIHYDPACTFAATPNTNSTKVLMALVVHLNLFQKSWDIEKAYVWATLDEKDRLIVQYPKGFERFDQVTGEPLYMILKRNLYGLPNAAHNFTKQRDAFILKTFNEGKWECKRCVMDPCLFVVTKESKRTWLLCYVDDIDCASESKEHAEEIFLSMNRAWKCKEVSSSYMLGITRTLTEQNGVRTMHMSMSAYVDGMYNTFKDYIPKRTAKTPCEHNLLLTLSEESITPENKRVLGRGYQSAVGMLLWASRGVFPQSLYTVQQLCKVMSKPTEHAWQVAMHLISWMHYRKDYGVTFRSDGNDVPICFSDASNRPDDRDSRRAYGYCIMWKGGAIISVSRKLDHCSSATAANEYMAISHATKGVVWMRQLMEELKLLEIVKQPTMVLGDNRTANQWVMDEKVTQGNMWILQCYHYVKEMASEGHIKIDYINTKFNIADIFTKGVPKEVLDALEQYLCGKANLNDLLEKNMEWNASRTLDQAKEPDKTNEKGEN